MKRNIIYTILGIVALAMGFNACQPDSYELGDTIAKETLMYSILPNPDDSNMIILTSLTPGVTPHWITPLGRSTRMVDTVKLPFEGVYKFAYGVMSSGGYIQDDTIDVQINTNNLDYLKGDLWSLLAGGIGESKTWYLDLDVDAVSRAFAGPLYFYGTDNGWLGDCYGDDCWNWNPDYASNTWLMDAGDYGTMTFDLIGNANLKVEHNMLDRSETGTYYIDVDKKTLKTSDAFILHDAGRDVQVVNWGDLKIMSLTDSTLQIAALRDEALSGEGACLLVYNFISEDYLNSWVPEETEDPEPELPDGWQDDVSVITTTTSMIKWVLSPETPFNWANLDGSLMNTSWVSPDTYADWTGMTVDVPATYADFSLTMNSSDSTVQLVLPDGTESEGTYSLNSKGIYTFTGVKPNFIICGGWVEMNTTAENQWRILSLEKDAGGNVTGMWVGALATDKPEYMCYKLVPQSGGGGSEEPQGTEVTFDATKILADDLEKNGNFRFELYNEYGSGTKADPPFAPTDIVFSNRLAVTFTLSGVTFNEGAVGSYLAGIQYANSDWSVQYWFDSWSDGSGSAGEVMVTGDGTYTVYFEPGTSVANALVFVVDIKAMGADMLKDGEGNIDMTNLTATIDKIVLY